MRNINAKSFDKMRFILNSIHSRNFLMHRFLVEALKKESGDAWRTLKAKRAAVRESGGYFEN